MKIRSLARWIHLCLVGASIYYSVAVIRIYEGEISDNTDHEYIPPVLSSPFEFAACLLIKDDNQILPEWLAYHYTVLPLRRLIVAVDPLSKTSPQSILDAYHNIGMNITVWSDNSYWTKDGRFAKEKLRNFDPTNHTADHAHAIYLRRQLQFLTACLRQLHTEGRHSWVLLADTDEYLNYNAYRPSEQNNALECSGRRALKARCRIRQALNNGTHPRLHIGDRRVGRPNETIAHWLTSDLDPRWSMDKFCFSVPRLQFGGRNISQTRTMLPPFSSRYFHTYHYTDHASKIITKPGKSLVNLQRMNQVGDVLSPHRAFAGKCSGARSPDCSHSTLRIQHYSGTLETHMSRFGRDAQQYERKNDFSVEDSDESVFGWLPTFVQTVGQERAWNLTQGLRQEAYRESKELQGRLERNETVPPVFEWTIPESLQ